MKVIIDYANGIRPGQRVQWRSLGAPRQFGTVEKIYLSFKYPRGLCFWREPTIKVNAIFLVRDRYGCVHSIPQDRIVKGEK